VYNAHYITGDPKKDLALIKIDGQCGFKFINLDNPSPNLLGLTVIVLGNSVGYGSSISRGVLSGLKRDITIDNLEYKDLLQTDAAINPGNSGGPVVDLAGKLVGVSSVKMAFTPQGVPTQGLGFAIPGELVRTKVEEFKKIAANEKTAKRQAPASLARKYFGLQLEDVTADVGEKLGLELGSGVLVTDIDSHSPAADAGITRGLIIYQVGRYVVSSTKQVEGLLEMVTT